MDFFTNDTPGGRAPLQYGRQKAKAKHIQCDIFYNLNSKATEKRNISVMNQFFLGNLPVLCALEVGILWKV